MHPRRLLWHCGWCHPLAKWQLALYPTGIRWTTGMCAACLAREKRLSHARRAAVPPPPQPASLRQVAAS